MIGFSDIYFYPIKDISIIYWFYNILFQNRLYEIDKKIQSETLQHFFVPQ